MRPIPPRWASVLMVVLGLSGCTKAPESEPALALGERGAVFSNVLGEERTYWVSLPEFYNDSTYALQEYPVLYVLDAEWNYRSTSAVVEFMSTWGGVIPEMIVVGIPNMGLRVRDFTPTHSLLGDTGIERASLEPSGGGDAFLEFVRTELFPAIESRYRTRPYRVLVGHSLGGLLVLHTLVHEPSMFQAYVAIDPSLWFDQQALLSSMPDYFGSAKLEGQDLFLAQANTVRPSMPLVNVHFDGISRFNAMMGESDQSGIRYSFQYYEEDGHLSVPLRSLQDALRHIFQGYWVSNSDLFDDLPSVATRFEKLSERLGIVLHPAEAMIDWEADYSLNEMKDPDSAIPLFRMNVQNYPTSFHAFSSLGDAYAAKGEIDLAVRNFERSLELKPDHEHALARLRELRGGDSR